MTMRLSTAATFAIAGIFVPAAMAETVKIYGPAVSYLVPVLFLALFLWAWRADQ